MPEELNIKQLTKEAENGEPCNLMRALDDVDFSGKVKILNDVVQNNKSNRSTDPSLPEISISKTASKDEQGVPVAELALKVPGGKQ